MNPPHPALPALQADFPAALAELDQIELDHATRSAKLELRQQPLSIGIIGQVKSGKSSFLNALLFGAAAVLPKAATPKTANLTRIRHGAQAALHVHFYDAPAWAALQALAASAAESDAARAARELVRHARERATPVSQCLELGQLQREVAGVAELQALLNDYVGADGLYTPLVASTDITWPDPALEGLEIVDTPGVNDPIHSRVQKTRDYLAACDVVFLLSPCSRLMDSTDVDLFALQAPAKGVKRLELVATQFDTALLEDGAQRPSLAATRANLLDRLPRHAAKSLQPYVQRLRAQGRDELAQRLEAAAQRPHFMSSFAYAFAECAPEQWAEDERHTHQGFLEIAAEVWHEAPPSPEQWRELAGFAPLQQALARARSEKEAILAEQRAQLLPQHQQSLADWAQRSAAQVRERIALLERHDLAQLGQREAALAAQVQRIAHVLAELVSSAALAAQARSRELQAELRGAAARAAQIQTRTGYETTRHSVRVSDTVIYKPWTWGSYHYESSSSTSSYRYVAVSDAIDQALGYVRQSEAQLAAEIEALAAPATLSPRLRQALLQAIDSADERFDPLALRALVAQALEAIAWPRWDFTLPDPTSEIVARFGNSGEIRSEAEMSALRQRHDALLGELNQRFASALHERVQTLSEQLGSLASTLSERLTAALQADLAQLRAALQEGQAAKTRYTDLLQHLQNWPGAAAAAPHTP